MRTWGGNSNVVRQSGVDDPLKRFRKMSFGGAGVGSSGGGGGGGGDDLMSRLAAGRRKLQQQQAEHARAMPRMLPARAGDVDDSHVTENHAAPPPPPFFDPAADDTNGAQRGFFVYWPEGEMATFMNSDFVQMASLMGDEKAKESFSAISQGCAWNPLDGPGWPGIYADRRLVGVAGAPPGRVERFATWEEAWTRWNAWLDGRTKQRDYMLCFRTPLADGVGAAELGAAMGWFLKETSVGKGLNAELGVSVVACHRRSDGAGGGSGYVALTVEGNRSAHDLISNLTWQSAEWHMALGGGKLCFQLVHPLQLEESEELDAAAKPPKPAQDSDPNTRPYSQVFERREEALGVGEGGVQRRVRFKSWRTLRPGVTYV